MKTPFHQPKPWVNGGLLTGAVVLILGSTALRAFDPKKINADSKPPVVVTTLAQEREEMAVEIETELLYLEKSKEATVLLRQLPTEPSAARNVDDAMKAFGLVDDRLSAATGLAQAGKFQEAAEAFEKLVNPSEKTFKAVAARWGRVQALQDLAKARVRTGLISDEEILVTDAAAALGQDFPEKASFALRAHQLAIAGYEKEARMFYAYKQYVGYLDAAERLGLNEAPETKRIRERVAKLAPDLNNPLGAINRLMGESRELLEKADTGSTTRVKQQEIVTWLNDLIQTEEEKQSKSPPPKPNPSTKSKTGNSSKVSQGNKSGSAPKSGGKKPSSPATGGYVINGDGNRVGELGEIHPSDRSDEWGKLPPAEREKFLQQLKERFPDRYEEILKEYFKELAEDRAPAAATPPQ